MSAAEEREKTAAAVRELGALPMPVGPGPLALSEQQIEALAAAGNRVVNNETHEHLCMCDAWPKGCSSTGEYYMGAWDVSGLEDALPAVLGLWESMRGGELGALPVPSGPESLPVAVLLERAATVATHLYEYSAGVGETWDWLAGYAVPELVAEVGRQQARVAELEGLARDSASYAALLEGRLREIERTPFSLDADASADEPAAPDFFQPGRTYLRFVGDRELYFRVTSVSTDNPNQPDSLAGDGPVAHGWVRTERSATVWGPGGYTNFAGWHDVTEAGGE